MDAVQPPGFRLPGFVDLQVNGFAGVDFSSPDLSEDAFVDACRRLFREGTAMFLPTVITAPPEVYERNLPLMARVMGREEFRGRLPGFHIEGPFISPRPGAVGAHNPEWVRPPDVSFLRRLLDWSGGRIRMLTLAPELPGAEEVARAAAAEGILVAAGHTLAGPEDLRRLARAGARVFTHLGNGLPSPLPKFDNPLWAGLADDDYTATLIADGHHIPDGALKAMIRAKGVGRVAVVSDASPPAGLPPGRYTALGNQIVLEPSGRLHNPEKGCLVGSSATMLHCVNHLASLGFLSVDDLAAMGFRNPLKLLGIDPAGVKTGPGVVWDAAGRRFGVCRHG